MARAAEARLPPVTAATRHLRNLSLDAVLFILALTLFLGTRLWGLDRFPVGFLGDEAIQSVTAADFVHHGFRDQYGDFLPTYFQNGGAFNLSVSVYAQVIPYLLFGFSIFATRATSVLIATTGVAAVSLILRDALRIRFWWVGALLLSITPAWFLHSRTALETVIATSFYAWFLYCYLRYRTGAHLFLYPAVTAAALAFYAYSPMEAVIVATAFCLVLSDANYHRRHAGTVLGGLALAAVLALPYLRFLHEHGSDATEHLRSLNSYLVDPTLGTGTKIRRFLDEYRHGLSPHYWYEPNNAVDLLRHQMKGYGNILRPTAPFLVLGLGICLANLRSSVHRAVLIALLCAPLGGSLAQTGVTRDLSLVVPAAVLTALGLDLLLRLLTRRISYSYVAVGVFAVLSAVQVYTLRDALVNGPRWTNNYGLYGLQYGARQVGAAVRTYLASTPSARIVVSPAWANNTDYVVRFISGNDARVRTDSIQSWRFSKLPIPSNLAFVATREEYRTIRRDRRFGDINVIEVLRYPDGSPGFYLLRLRYSAQAAAIFKREEAEHQRPVTESVSVDGVPAKVTHPQLGVGRIQDLFDGDSYTLARSLETNPFVVRITFAAPHRANGIDLVLATMQPAARVTIHEPGSQRSLTFRRTLDRVESNPDLSFRFGRPLTVASLEIGVRDIQQPANGVVHIRDIDFRHR